MYDDALANNLVRSKPISKYPHFGNTIIREQYGQVARVVAMELVVRVPVFTSC